MPIINQIVKGGGGSSVAEPYLEFTVQNGQLKSTTSRVINLSGVTTLSTSMLLAYSYYNNTSATGVVNMGDVTTISGSYACQSMFENATGITGFDLSSLETISSVDSCNGMFKGCTGITTANLGSLKKISGTRGCSDMFSGCTGITSVDFSSLETISGLYGCSQMFLNISAIPTVSFPSLSVLTGSFAMQRMFSKYDSTLSNISFYALTPSSFGTQTNQFVNMLQYVTGCTVHFPMAIQSTIGSWSDVTNGFGGTNTTVLFDIVTTLTGADTNSYTRSQKNSTSTATAWTYNDTLYYTNGTTEPVVNDTIYSDAACTTVVTTISAIA